MAAPEVPIDVEPETGIWRTDGLPMIYVPRHFLVNNHRAMEAALGIPAHRAILTQSGDASALHWCEKEAQTHGLDAEATFRHYLRRLSQRGWGRFSILALDPAAGSGRFAVEHSVYALEYGADAGRCVCYAFEGYFTGAMRYVLRRAGCEAALRCTEVACAAAGDRACHFVLECRDIRGHQRSASDRDTRAPNGSEPVTKPAPRRQHEWK
ncbi:MAG: 4-vinyl reductase [Acidisphaera sp.]|nr:4-vinyl reductase [Acidisphaera sp.]